MSDENKKPIIKLAQVDPEQVAVYAKLVQSHLQAPMRDEKGTRKVNVPNSEILKQRLSKRAKKKVDAEAVLKLLPDVELGIRILTSCILSPSDMTSTELNWLAPEDFLTSDVNATMMKMVRQHFESVYKIKPLLSKMLRNCLATEGSYPVCVIPENAIDDIINGSKRLSMEQLSTVIDTNTKMIKPIGILGSYSDEQSDTGLNITTESLQVNKIKEKDCYFHFKASDDGPYIKNDYVYITDNPVVLRIPDINKINRSNQSIKAYGSISTESIKIKTSDYRIESSLYANKKIKGEQFVAMKTPDELTRVSVGHPLIKKFPAESVIPIFVPGEPEKQIGFFICLDEEGVPIQAANNDQYYSNLSGGFGSGGPNGSLTSGIIQRVSANMGGNQFDSSSSKHLEMSMKIYSELVEKDLLTRVKNGIRSSNVSISRNEQIYEIMLARTLSRKLTQMLYIPADYMTYIAFKYGDDGIGRSLLDDTATINALRVVLLFSDVVGSIKNSIGRTAATLTLDPRDPDPIKTIEMAQNEIVRARQLSVPLSVSNVTDITDFIQRAGFEWKFEGHPDIPDVSFDFQDVQSNKQKADGDLQDTLRKASIMGTYVSPEMVDNGFNSEFAASVVANNLLFSKRIIEMQEVFNPQLTTHLRKCVRFSQPLLAELKAFLIENKEKLKLEDMKIFDYSDKEITDDRREPILINEILNQFVDNFSVELPKPSSITLEQQMTDLNNYSDAIDKAIELGYINDQLINENTVGEFSGNLETLKAMYKSHFMRKYLTEKGIMNELADITSLNENGKSTIDMPAMAEEHMLALIRSMVPTVAVLNAIKAKMEAASDELGFKTPEDVPEADSGSSDSGSDEGGDGADQFSMDIDVNQGQADTGQGQAQTTEQVTQQTTTQTKTQQTTEQAPDETGTL